jgi:chitinase
MYSAAGLYTITLQATDANGVSGKTDHTIAVANNNLIVDFTYSPPAPVPGQSVSFTSTVTGANGYPPVAPLTYSWTFGDGTTGNVADPNHTYVSAGRYQVYLTVTDANSIGGSALHVVKVGFTVDFTCTISGLTVSCAANTNGGNPPFSFSWNFGGPGSGTGLSGPTAMWTYTSKGRYTVTLTGTDNTGNTDSVAHIIFV